MLPHILSTNDGMMTKAVQMLKLNVLTSNTRYRRRAKEINFAMIFGQIYVKGKKTNIYEQKSCGMVWGIITGHKGQ